VQQVSIALEEPRTAAETSRAIAAQQTLDWTLRVGCAMCFVGHGAFGIFQKPAWAAYFAVVGIGRETAFDWMPLVGAWDILMGVLVLTYPRPAIAVWMTGWALWTALLRPLAGEPVWETLERAGNYGVPLALFLRMGPLRSWRDAFGPARFGELTPAARTRIMRVLQWTVVLLLAGHGVLSLTRPPTSFYGVFPSVGGPPSLALLVSGWLDLALAAAVAFRPGVRLLLGVAAWKMASELAFFASGPQPVWEWIERGGSYVAPIALAIGLATTAPAPAAAGRTPRPTA
jgi:hypothetical protein